ncbi:MAG TPA: hypothetical protein VHP37_01395 [Burkholderiales bacterium]|nr:hypothetical protein [Burkholderiales bacterium]
MYDLRRDEENRVRECCIECVKLLCKLTRTPPHATLEEVLPRVSPGIEYFTCRQCGTRWVRDMSRPLQAWEMA